MGADERLQQHIDRAGILTSWEANGYHKDDRGWEHQRINATVSHAVAGRYSFTYRRGMGTLDYDVTAVDLVASILFDGSTVDGYTFDEWADEMGVFPIESSADYARAVASYNACQESLRWCKAAFGRNYRHALRASEER